MKELFESIPTIDELHALAGEGNRADIILVDSKKDKKLSMLKQWIVTLVKGFNSNPAAVIKKIAGLVITFDNCCVILLCHCSIFTIFLDHELCTSVHDHFHYFSLLLSTVIYFHTIENELRNLLS